MTDKKIKAGRPSKYKPEFCAALIEHMRAGFSFESFAAIVNINNDTIYEWSKKNKEFAEAKKIAFAQSRLFWEKLCLENMHSSKEVSFNTTLWIFNMKNRFGWRDRVEMIDEDDYEDMEFVA